MADTIVPQRYVSAWLVPRLIGRLFAFALYGVSVSIFARYLLSGDSLADSTGARLYMTLVMTMVTMATVSLGVDTISLAVAQERDLAFFDAVSVANLLYDVSYFLSIVLAQAFLARRAYLLTVHADAGTLSPRQAAKKRPVLLILLALAPLSMAVSLVGYIADTVQDVRSFRNEDLSDNTLESYGFAIGLIASAVADIAISTTLSWHYIRWFRSEGGFNPQISSILRKLAVFTVTTALFTTVPAIVAAGLEIPNILPSGAIGSLVFTVFSGPLPQLYSICLFCTFTLRRSLRSRGSLQPSLPVLPSLLQRGTQSTPTRLDIPAQNLRPFDKKSKEDLSDTRDQRDGFDKSTVDSTGGSTRTVGAEWA